MIEWISTGAIYTALLMLFVNLGLRAWEADSTGGLIAFGLLCALFGGGLVVTLVNTVQALSRRRKTQTSTTN